MGKRAGAPFNDLGKPRLSLAASCGAAQKVTGFAEQMAVPGRDIHTEARDHTVEAVWRKVTAALGKQIRKRKARQDSRLKRNGEVRGKVGWRTGSAGGWG